MKKDIKNREDIELLVNLFYDKLKMDDSISPFFTDVVKVNWEKHLPIMYDFWENILFYQGNYEGNPMAKHHSLQKNSQLSKKHFQIWQNLFKETVHENFKGVNATLIIQKALSIGTVMQGKLFG